MPVEVSERVDMVIHRVVGIEDANLLIDSHISSPKDSRMVHAS